MIARRPAQRRDPASNPRRPPRSVQQADRAGGAHAQVHVDNAASDAIVEIDRPQQPPRTLRMRSALDLGHEEVIQHRQQCGSVGGNFHTHGREPTRPSSCAQIKPARCRAMSSWMNAWSARVGPGRARGMRACCNRSCRDDFFWCTTRYSACPQRGPAAKPAAGRRAAVVVRETLTCGLAAPLTMACRSTPTC